MKLSLFVLSALSLAGSAIARVGEDLDDGWVEEPELYREEETPGASRRRQLRAMHYRELLEQPECDDLMEEVGRELTNVMHLGDSPVKKFLCNAIGRMDAKDDMKKLKEEVKERKLRRELGDDDDDDDEGPLKMCADAFDEMIADGDSNLKKAAKNYKSCEEETTKELGIVKEEVAKVGGEDRLRRLLELELHENYDPENPEHRELWGSWVKKVARKVIPKIIKKIPSPIRMIWRRVKTFAMKWVKVCTKKTIPARKFPPAVLARIKKLPAAWRKKYEAILKPRVINICKRILKRVPGFVMKKIPAKM